jgi:hypothetical protein
VGVDDDSDSPPSYVASLPPSEELMGESQAMSEGTQVTWADTQPPSLATQEDATMSAEDLSSSYSQNSQGTSDHEDEEIQVTQVRIFIIHFGSNLKKCVHASGRNYSSSFKEAIHFGSIIIHQFFK